MDRVGPRAVIELGVGADGARACCWRRSRREPWHLYATLGRAGGRRQRVPGLFGPVAVPAQLVRAPARPRHRHRLRRRRRRLDRAAAVACRLSSRAPAGARPAGRWAFWCWSCWRRSTCCCASRPQDMGLQPDGDAAPSATAARPPSNVVDTAWAAVDWTLGRAMRTARFWWIAFGYFCGLYAWYAVQVHQTKYLIEIGFSPSVAAWALGLVSLAGIPGQIALGHVSDRIGREWVWTAGCLGFAVVLRWRCSRCRTCPEPDAALRDDRGAGRARLRPHLGVRGHRRRDLPGQALRHASSAR